MHSRAVKQGFQKIIVGFFHDIYGCLKSVGQRDKRCLLDPIHESNIALCLLKGTQDPVAGQLMNPAPGCSHCVEASDAAILLKAPFCTTSRII